MASVLAIGIPQRGRGDVRPGQHALQVRCREGSIRNAVPFLYGSFEGYDLGQWQEPGRDQGHTLLSMGQMGAIFEMAWNQGDDVRRGGRT
ncbi:hypothetical protein GCM10010261_20940 [Streptomyces pilosus]|nr:hypothetical protein GCM10010261_20940 [Streptomyces pilosus]